MELPVDIWAVVRDVLTPTEWAMACGTCNATRALSRPLVAAEMCGWLGRDEQTLIKQLQLERWSGCHSLCLKLRNKIEDVKVTAAAAQIEELTLGGSLSSLRCLHIIGRSRVPLTKSSAEGVFMSLLAAHVSVLTLDVKTVSMPVDLPKLCHLILDLSTSAGRETLPTRNREQTHEALFLAVSRLVSLKSLYVQSSSTAISGATDLTPCPHLRCVALQGVGLEGGVALPAECLLHVLHGPQHNIGIMSSIDSMVTGVSMHHRKWWHHQILVFRSELNMLKLRRLQLTIYEKCGEDTSWPLDFSGSKVPALKVLELDVRSNVSLWLDDGLALESLVVIAAGTLQLDVSLDIPLVTLKQMYLKSGATFVPSYRERLEKLYAREPSAEFRLLDYVREEQDGWMAQMPASFHPRNLQQCWCGACSECLVRAGVPILCDQAWTSDGFDERLRPHCNAMA